MDKNMISMAGNLGARKTELVTCIASWLEVHVFLDKGYLFVPDGTFSIAKWALKKSRICSVSFLRLSRFVDWLAISEKERKLMFALLLRNNLSILIMSRNNSIRVKNSFGYSIQKLSK